MTSTATVWTVIVLAGVVTYSVRGSFLLVAGRLEALPELARLVLRMIPAAAISALVAPAVLRDGAGELALLGPRALAGVIALVVAVRFRNILLTIVTGLISVTVFTAVLG